MLERNYLKIPDQSAELVHSVNVLAFKKHTVLPFVTIPNINWYNIGLYNLRLCKYILQYTKLYWSQREFHGYQKVDMILRNSTEWPKIYITAS